MQLGLPWVDNLQAEEQPQFKTNSNCVFWETFVGGLNDWNIVKLAPRKENNLEELEVANRWFLSHGLIIALFIGSNQAFILTITFSSLLSLQNLKLVDYCAQQLLLKCSMQVLCFFNMNSTILVHLNSAMANIQNFLQDGKCLA